LLVYKITAALQQLADHHEQLAQLTDLITGIGDTLREHEAALAAITEATPAGAGPDRYRPSPPPAWWKLAAADRQEPIARLTANSAAAEDPVRRVPRSAAYKEGGDRRALPNQVRPQQSVPSTASSPGVSASRHSL
jgi:hypothetical protein